MRIAIVSPRFSPFRGGVELFCNQLALGLSSHGHDVVVVTTVPSSYRGPFIERGQFGIHRFRDLSPIAIHFSFGLILHLLIKRHDYDLIVNNNYHSILSLIVGFLPHHRKVFVPHFHGILGHGPLISRFHALFRFHKFLSRTVMDNSTRIICGSNYESRLILENFAEVRSKVNVIREGIIQVTCKDGTIREPETLLTVTRLERYKGVQNIISALSRLPEYKLRIVGEGTSKDELQCLVQKLNLSKRVEFYPNVDDEKRNKLYCSSSVFVLLSQHESVGVTVGEALSARTPCVVLTSSALLEWVDNTNCFGIDDRSNYDQISRTIREAEKTMVTISVPTWSEYVSKFENEILSVPKTK